MFSLKVENDDEDADDDDEGFVASKLAVVGANDGTGGVDVDDVGVEDAVEGVGEYWHDCSDSTSDDVDLLYSCLACVAAKTGSAVTAGGVDVDDVGVEDAVEGAGEC